MSRVPREVKNEAAPPCRAAAVVWPSSPPARAPPPRSRSPSAGRRPPISAASSPGAIPRRAASASRHARSATGCAPSSSSRAAASARTRSTISFYAVGTPDGFTVTETSTTRARRPRTTSPRPASSAGSPSGSSGTWAAASSATSSAASSSCGRAARGSAISGRPHRQELKLGVAATYNHQKEKVPDPGHKDNFAGARFTADYAVKFGTNEAERVHQQAGPRREPRGHRGLPLGLGQRAHGDGEPPAGAAARRQVGLPQPAGAAGGGPVRNDPGAGASSNAKVLAPYKKTDVSLTVSFVLNWGPAGPSGARPTP